MATAGAFDTSGEGGAIRMKVPPRGASLVAAGQRAEQRAKLLEESVAQADPPRLRLVRVWGEA